MPATLHTFDDHGINTCFFNTLCQFDTWNYRNNFNFCSMKFFDMRNRIASAQSYKGNFFFTNHINNLCNIRSHQHDIDAERFSGQIFGFSDFIAGPLYSAATCSNNTSAAGIGNSSCQICI